MTRAKKVTRNFAPEFSFLLAIDPAFEDWGGAGRRVVCAAKKRTQ